MASAAPATGNVVASVLYPAKVEGTDTPNNFNMEYYLSHHMPLVKKNWTPLGLKSAIVVGHDPAASGFVAECVLVFENAEQMAAIMQDTEVHGDTPNYTQAKPIIKVGQVVSTW